MGSLLGAPTPFDSAPPLVGREREQRLLRDALAATLGGRGGLVLIVGEAGIGKTALARDFAREAQARGAAVLFGRAYDLSEPPPYGLWLDLLGSGATANPTDPLAGSRAALQPAAGQTRGNQAAIFARAFAGFAQLAQQRPLVCLLDDLHWADPASFDLLRCVARQLATLPLLLVGTYRADELAERHPLITLLPALVREAAPLRIAVLPLEPAAVRQLVRTGYALAASAEARLIGYLQAQAAGNPLYLGELLRTLEEERLLQPGAAAGWTLADLTGVRVPPLLRQVIAERLDRLGADAKRWLTAAAVIGHEVPLALWAAVAEAPEDELLTLVERATAARVLEALPDGLRVQFHHQLIREALYDSLSPPRRRAIHQRVGDLFAAPPTPDPDSVAYHLQQVGDPRAVEWLVRAGHRAQRVAAPRTAAERYGAALALLADGGDPAERGWLLLYLSLARYIDDPHGGIGHLREVVRLATVAGDRALAAYARYRLGFHLTGVGDQRQGLLEMTVGVEAMEALNAEEQLRVRDPGYQSGTHIGTLALRLAQVGRYEEARARALQASARGDEQNANFALAEIYGALGRVAEALPLRARGYATLQREGNWLMLGLYMWFGLQRLVISYQADQLEQRQQLAAAATAAFTRSGGLQGEVAPRLGHLPLLVLEGEWAEARALAVTVEAGSRAYRPGVVSLLADLNRSADENPMGWTE